MNAWVEVRGGGTRFSVIVLDFPCVPAPRTRENPNRYENNKSYPVGHVSSE